MDMVPQFMSKHRFDFIRRKLIDQGIAQHDPACIPDAR